MTLPTVIKSRALSIIARCLTPYSYSGRAYETSRAICGPTLGTIGIDHPVPHLRRHEVSQCIDAGCLILYPRRNVGLVSREYFIERIAREQLAGSLKSTMRCPDRVVLVVTHYVGRRWRADPVDSRSQTIAEFGIAL